MPEQQELEFISLAELIDNVKNDLLKQNQPAGDDKQPPLLFIEEIEITAQVVVQRGKSEGGKAGLKFAVLGFGTNAEVHTKSDVSQQLTQSFKLKLTPLHSKETYLKILSPQELRETMQLTKQVFGRFAPNADDGTEEIA